MMVAPGQRASTSRANRISWRSGQMIWPDLVTTPRRSPSPSKARPSSQSVLVTWAIRSCRLRGSAGSGWWLGNVPSTSQ
ncbi:Uncharacterised protein [Bordetella pertussis]|nr:Uncharacterised protein [Bordetella pertussis]